MADHFVKRGICVNKAGLAMADGECELCARCWYRHGLPLIYHCPICSPELCRQGVCQPLTHSLYLTGCCHRGRHFASTQSSGCWVKHGPMIKCISDVLLVWDQALLQNHWACFPKHTFDANNKNVLSATLN